MRGVTEGSNALFERAAPKPFHGDTKLAKSGHAGRLARRRYRGFQLYSASNRQWGLVPWTPKPKTSDNTLHRKGEEGPFFLGDKRKTGDEGFLRPERLER